MFKLVKLLKFKLNLNIRLSRTFSLCKMANSRYEYVKDYELDDRILPNCWIVVRVDGKGFHKFCKEHDFQKPNDERGLNLMNFAAVTVMKEFSDIIISYGQSDEYSFVFHKNCNIFKRREAKIMTYVNSLFTSAYVYNWGNFFEDKTMKYPPCFDARIVLYPSDENLRDYLSWRQADVHINNLYNTCFWNLVENDGKTNAEAEEFLRGTFAKDKNEILFSKFGINYNNVIPMYRKGTILLRKKVRISASTKATHQLIVPVYEDLIQEKFWTKHSELLGKKVNTVYELDGLEEKGLSDCDKKLLPDILWKQFKNLNLS